MSRPSLAGILALALVVLAGCGSSSNDKTTAAGSSTAATGSTQQTVPSIHSGSPPPPSKKVTTTKAPPPAPNGNVIQVKSYLAFKNPTGKIGCAYTKSPTTLRCDTAFPTRFSHMGHKCTGGIYGQAFEVSPSGKSRAVCAGDTVLSASSMRTIPYGHAWTIGPYACTSQTSSLTCTNGAGHGVRLSLKQQLLF